MKAVIEAYAAHFDPPAETIPFRLHAGEANDVAVVVYLPEDAESTTQLCTAGLSAHAIGSGFRAEVAIAVKGAVEAGARRDLADAIVTLGAAPLKTGRPFSVNQILENVRLPLFEKFNLAILTDWDPVYGFTFPNLPEEVSLLRVVPLFESEAKFLESIPDRTEAYVRLYSRGLEPEDYNREPAA